jgi:hypothetical protein
MSPEKIDYNLHGQRFCWLTLAAAAANISNGSSWVALPQPCKQALTKGEESGERVLPHMFVSKAA